MLCYSIVEEIPDVQIYCDIRLQCNLTPRTLESATVGLARSLYGVSVIDDSNGKVIGMGRIMGDLGCFCTIVDICVLPDYQKNGIGKSVMKVLMKFVNEKVPKDSDVTLLAVGDAQYLYNQFQFYSTAPMGTIAMRYKRDLAP
jgi:ribosomal protein S18 acetylase RimI-like enzyme